MFQNSTGNWEYTHRRVAEKKLGQHIVPGEHVHHINKDREDNRPENLVVYQQTFDIDQQIHKSSFNERNACFCCGNTSHWAQDCYATTDVDGNKI